MITAADVKRADSPSFLPYTRVISAYLVAYYLEKLIKIAEGQDNNVPYAQQAILLKSNLDDMIETLRGESGK